MSGYRIFSIACNSWESHLIPRLTIQGPLEGLNRTQLQSYMGCLELDREVWAKLWLRWAKAHHRLRGGQRAWQDDVEAYRRFVALILDAAPMEGEEPTDLLDYLVSLDVTPQPDPAALQDAVWRQYPNLRDPEYRHIIRAQQGALTLIALVIAIYFGLQALSLLLCII